MFFIKIRPFYFMHFNSDIVNLPHPDVETQICDTRAKQEDSNGWMTLMVGETFFEAALDLAG